MGFFHELRLFFIGEKPATKAESRLLRKIDTTILTFVCLSQFVNYLDRQNLANAYVSGMKEELGFQGTQYNQAVSIFTAGYIIGGIPNALIVSSNRIRLSIWFPFCCMMWGMLTLGLGFTKHVYQVEVIRFFQAIFESSTFAGSHYILGAWYKPSELGKRACLITAASNGGILFSGVLQGGIQSTLDGKCGLSGWRWLMIIDSLITAPIWILGFLTFPEQVTPANTRAFYITEEERRQAVDRLPPHKPTKLDWNVFMKVGRDWRFYAFTIMFSLNTNMEFAGLYSIMSLYLKWAKTYTVQQINYYPLGTTAVTIAGTAFFALWTDYTKSRWWVNIVMALCAGLSSILLLVWDIPLGLKYFAYYFAGLGYIGQAVNFAWANEVCRDDDQLRALTLYSMVYGSNVTIAWFNIALFPVTDAPRFRNGMIAVIVTCVISPPMAIVLRHYDLKRRTKLAGLVHVLPEDQVASTVPAIEEKQDDKGLGQGDVQDTQQQIKVTTVLAA
ncbi:major facilitator superfamily domain-containing protein [Naematelia encephala]|uniref:Major facilitator superfamily domain-containing protein n=1 Tax=Naematelia encephala TaxID=71784 RepID=A0A1Y2B9S8_9TREE|nr:major facilitator superfamily domain-containing protein [Naematelia encephala]